MNGLRPHPTRCCSKTDNMAEGPNPSYPHFLDAKYGPFLSSFRPFLYGTD